jgi:hypothetical protein
MRSWLSPILDIGTNPGDDPDLVVRKRTAVGTLVALCAAGIAYVADVTCRLLAGRYPFERRDGVEVKGKGTMSTWVLNPAAEIDRVDARA